MPLYECRCEDCGYVHQELMPYSQLSLFIEELEDGEFVHTTTFEDGFTGRCGTFRYMMSLPNLHSAPGVYPFETSPWLLPPKVVDGKSVPNIVTVHNRAEYTSLLKKHGLAERETAGERRTMYADKDVSYSMDSDVDGDMKMYNQMLRNPEARKRIIKDNIAKSRSLLNGTA